MILRKLLAFAVLFFPVLAIAYEPPPFDAARRLVVVEPGAAVPGNRAEAEAALATTTTRIYGVITSKAEDPRHRALRWGSETEAAIERTWEAWAMAPGFDAARDVLVLVALDQREVRIRTGSTWDATYGLHTTELSAITDASFVPRARAGDLYGALAATARATDRRFSELAAMAPTLPGRTDKPLSVWPPAPLLPRVARGLLDFSPLGVDVQLHVAQRLPDDAAPDALVAALRQEGPDAIAILWDVGGDRVAVAAGPAWPEGDVQAFAAGLVERGRDDEGHLTSAKLAPAVHDGVRALRAARMQAAVAARQVAVPVRGDPRNLWVHPPTLDLGQTRAALAALPPDLHVIVVERADREGGRVAPDGDRWTSHLARSAGMPRRLPRLVIIGEPFEAVLDGDAVVRREDHTIPLDPAWIAGEPGDVGLDAAAADLIGRLSSGIAEHERQIEAARLAEERAMARLRDGLIGLGALLVFAIVAFAAISGAASRRRRFAVVYDDLAHAVTSARQRYADLRVDAELTARVRALQGRGPTTSALFAEIGAELDEIEIGLRTLERRLSDAAPSARRWTRWLWRFDLHRAIAALEGPVRIEAPAGDVDLFSPVDGTTLVPLASFMDRLRARYAAVSAGWDRLVGAVDVSLHAPSAEVEAADLPAFARWIDEAGLSPRWYDRHPLVAGAADHERLDALRRADPVAYFDALSALRAEVQAFRGTMDALARAFAALPAAVADAERTLARAAFDAVVSHDDDPAAAAPTARVRDAEARHALDLAADPALALAAVRAAVRGWGEIVTRRARIDDAIATVAARLQAVRAAVAATRGRHDALRSLIAGELNDHVGAADLDARRAAAEVRLASAEQELVAAHDAAAARRVVDAVRWEEGIDPVLREVDAAIRALADEADAAQRAEARARELVRSFGEKRREILGRSSADATRLRAEMANADTRRQQVTARVQAGGPQDWAAVAAEAGRVIAGWQSAVAAVEAAEAAERAAAAAAAAAAARASASSSSSSSTWSSSSSSSWSSSSGGSSYSSGGGSGGSSYSSGGRSGGSSW